MIRRPPGSRLRIQAERRPWMDKVEVHIVADSVDDGPLYAAQALTFVKVEEGAMREEPAMSLRPAEAQLLMDELWRAGLRPTEGTGSAGSLAATERHLADMRNIAMGLLKGEM